MVWSNQAPTSLVFPPGAITGARIVIDENGVVIYDAANHPVFVAAPNGVVPGNDFTDSPMVFGGTDLGVATQQILTPTDRLIFGNLGIGTGVAAITWPDNPDGCVSIVNGNGIEVISNSFGYGNDTVIIGPATAGVNLTGDYSLGSGLLHQYYSECYALDTTQNYVTGVVTTAKNMTPINIINDYLGVGLDTVTGIWTAPIDGIYTYSLHITFGLAAVFRYILFGLGARLDVQSTTGNVTFSHTTFRTAGSTFPVQIFQASGVNHTLTGGNVTFHLHT